MIRFLAQIIEAIADNRSHYQKESREQKEGKADLLISIHADAFSDRSVRGATLYALSDSRKIRRGSDYKK